MSHVKELIWLLCHFLLTSHGGYFVDKRRKKFYAAKKWCHSQGAELASIFSAKESAAAIAACGKQMCWLGLTEVDGNASTPHDLQTWKWEDGSILTYVNWQPGEPNNYGGNDEKFALMNLDIPEVPNLPRMFSGKWFDGPDYVEAHALCKDTVTKNTGANATIVVTPRPIGRTNYTLMLGRWTASQAESVCGVGMRMAMPKTHEQVEELLGVISSEGQSFSPHNGVLLGGHETTDGRWIWNDGSSIAPELWYPGQPSDDSGQKETQLCTWAAFRGKFHDCPDHGKWGTMRIVCEPGSISANSVSKISSAQTCDPRCYLVDEGRKSFYEARAWCRTHGAELVSIHNAADSDFAKGACGRRMCWIGLTEENGVAETPQASQIWRWEDGSRMRFANWQPGEPNNYGGNDERYAFMNLDVPEVSIFPKVFSGKWFDGPPTLRAHALCTTPNNDLEKAHGGITMSDVGLGAFVIILCMICCVHYHHLKSYLPCMFGYEKMPSRGEPPATELGRSHYIPPTLA